MQSQELAYLMLIDFPFLKKKTSIKQKNKLIDKKIEKNQKTVLKHAHFNYDSLVFNLKTDYQSKVSIK